MIGNPIVDGLIIAAAVVTSCGVLWRKVLKPLLRAADTIRDATPVLVSIAYEFEPNDGHSLRDVVNRIEKKADTAATESLVTRGMVEELAVRFNNHLTAEERARVDRADSTD